jgi:hypothetical protein
LFLVICASLAVHAVFRTRTPSWRDAPSCRLLLMRRLAIPAGSLVGSRAVSLLFALVLNVPAFFLPMFLFSDLGGIGTSYLWFAGVWIGYGLLASGLYLLLELTEGGRTYTLVSVGFALTLVVVLALLEWTVKLNLVERTAELTRSHGALPAILSVLVGAGAFALLSWLTLHRIQKRELSGDLSA